jgi:serine/threonine protein kinase
MGEENSTPKFNPQDPKKSVDVGGAHIDAACAPAVGDTTIDTGGTVVAAARAVDRTSIGSYMLVKKLGEGGMGQVWLAEQTAPVKRKVALKLIKGGLYDSAVIQRFESERQSLAVMDHPAIAKVFDAGSTKDGQPYFVMEYVDGLPITRYCDNKKLRIPERLELFIKVCEGIQHAHQKAIIHRDLKPSNVLVVEVDEKPVPRIIDFGIAKAISSQANAEQTVFTQVGAVVGTPGFMSPEQADPRVQDVDTRTDVYSLGVILYVLLTGTLPFDLEGWRKKPVDEVLRQLREEDPQSPSTKLREDKGTATDSAAKRATEPGQLVSMLQGDLDLITMKAVEKDRARRYGTPSELAADLRRYLHHEPVTARPVSSAYRVRKYVRRHRVSVGVAAGFLIVLIGFAINQSIQLRRITRERDRANRITEFMTSMFKVSEPSQSRGNSVTAREILDKASTDIDTGLAKDPELQAQLMDVMGRVYESLALYAPAQSLFERSAAIRTRVLGPNNPETLASISNLGAALADQGHYAQAEKIDRETLELKRRALGPQHPDTLITMNNLARNLRQEGRFSEAEKLDAETLNLRRRVLGPEHLLTLASMGNLAIDFEREGRYADAEKLDRQALDASRRINGQDDKDTLLLASNLGWILHKEGRYAEAETFLREAVDGARRVRGPEWPSLHGWTGRLADDLDAEGRYADAEKLHLEVVEILRRVLGPDNPATPIAISDLAITLQNEGHFTEAEKLDREAIEIQRRVLGPANPQTLNSLSNLAAVFISERRYTEAEKLYREANGIQRRVLGPEHPDTALSTYNLGVVALYLGRREQAISLLQEAVDHGLAPANALAMEQDPDLKPLHGDPRYEAIVSEAKQRAAAAQKPH